MVGKCILLYNITYKYNRYIIVTYIYIYRVYMIRLQPVSNRLLHHRIEVWLRSLAKFLGTPSNHINTRSTTATTNINNYDSHRDNQDNNGNGHI